MSSYVLGIDGGGTKTSCALFDTAGNKLKIIDSWEAAYQGWSKDWISKLQEVLDNLISFVLSEWNIERSMLEYCVFGLAGVDSKELHRKISEKIHKLGINRFTLCNDGYLGIKAGSRNGFGICSINGTGSTVAAIDPYGNMLQIGGMGDYTGDVGGGYYLGLKVISSVYNSFYKGDIPTVMTEKLLSILEIKSTDDYMDILFDRMDELKLNPKHLNKVVFEAANMGDVTALNILEHMGRENAKSVNGAISKLNFDKAEEIDIILAGSVNVRGENPTAVNTLIHDVMLKNPDRKTKFTILKYPPVAGAVIWALNEVNKNSDYFEKVLSQF